MGINHRLHKLEDALTPYECPDCGWSPPAPGDEIVIEWYDGWEETEDGELVEAPIPTEEPTPCPTCGQPDFIVIRWLDLDGVEDQRHKRIRDQLRDGRHGEA
jgi:hypothetical protein